MEYVVGTVLRNSELEEIVRLLLKPYQIRTLTITELAREDKNKIIRCLIIDWLQCTPRERRMILRGEQMATLMIIDLSGTLHRGLARRIFRAPFSWQIVVNEVLFTLGLDQPKEYAGYLARV